MADFSKRADLYDRIDQGRRCFSDEEGVDLRNISMLEDANSWTAVRREPTILACFNLPLNWRCEGFKFGAARLGRGGCCMHLRKFTWNSTTPLADTIRIVVIMFDEDHRIWVLQKTRLR
jgi:hypothetical protein